MLTVLLQPVLKCMHFFHTIAVFVLTASYHTGRALILVLIQACHIICEIFTTLAIIGEELYNFLCELNTSVEDISSYIRSSANGGVNCVVEVLGIFIKHISKFFLNTRLHSKLLATYIGGFIGDFLKLLRNALLLIADCAWWLITLLPRWLLCATITIGDIIVDGITSLRKVIVYVTQIILEDVFRLTIGFVLLFLLWNNRRRLVLTILKWIVKVKTFWRLCCLYLIRLTRRILRRRVPQTFTTPMRNLSLQRRSPLPRTSNSSSNIDKVIDPIQRCVICKDRQKCVLLLPCKHLCLCEECADYMFFSAHRLNCPLCRTFIDHSMSVYI